MKKTFQTKLFLQRNSIIFILLILTSCKVQFNFDKVISGNLISNELPLIYNNESIIKVSNYKIFIEKIEQYDKNLNLIEVGISKPEGSVSYSRKELEEDPLFTDYNKVCLDRKNISLKNNILHDNNKKYEIIYKTKDTILSINKNSILIIVKSK